MQTQIRAPISIKFMTKKHVYRTLPALYVDNMPDFKASLRYLKGILGGARAPRPPPYGTVLPPFPEKEVKN